MRMARPRVGCRVSLERHTRQRRRHGGQQQQHQRTSGRVTGSHFVESGFVLELSQKRGSRRTKEGAVGVLSFVVCRVVTVAARRRKSCASMSRGQPGGVQALYSLPHWGRCTSGGAWERRARERPEARGEVRGAVPGATLCRPREALLFGTVRYYLDVVDDSRRSRTLVAVLPLQLSLSHSHTQSLSPQYAPKTSVAVDAIAALLLI
jgi:hypothetical protein